MGMRKRQQSLALPWKNCHVAQAESWWTWPGRGRDLSFSDSQIGAWVPQRFICRWRIENQSLSTGGVCYSLQLGWRCLLNQSADFNKHHEKVQVMEPASPSTLKLDFYQDLCKSPSVLHQTEVKRSFIPQWVNWAQMTLKWFILNNIDTLQGIYLTEYSYYVSLELGKLLKLMSCWFSSLCMLVDFCLHILRQGGNRLVILRGNHRDI